MKITGNKFKTGDIVENTLNNVIHDYYVITTVTYYEDIDGGSGYIYQIAAPTKCYINVPECVLKKVKNK